MKNSHPLVVSNIKQETVDSVVVSFKTEGETKSTYKFKAGQYLTLCSKIKGKEIKRSYSICSDPQSGNLQVGVKAIKNGVYSNYINDALRVGDTVEVSFPEGRFVLDKSPANYLAFAAGSGITPIISIASDELRKNSNSIFVLGYGNKTLGSSMFKDALSDLKKEFPNRFFVHNTYSQENNPDSSFGRIDSGFINQVLKQHYSIDFEKVLLCGPEKMIQSATELLKDKSFNENQILYELFYSKASEKTTVSTKNSKATIIYDDETLSLEVPENMTILDAALQKNIDVPYSCQGGVCSSCIAKVSSGSASMLQNNILTDSEIEEGLVLTCQAVPKTQEITVDFDDV
jgi:ring-1,2-phenylacetyl-CoA epoxidase subunit PaaE